MAVGLSKKSIGVQDMPTFALKNPSERTPVRVFQQPHCPHLFSGPVSAQNRVAILVYGPTDINMRGVQREETVVGFFAVSDEALRPNDGP